MLIFAMSATTFAAGGISVTAQGRTVKVEVKENHVYNVIIQTPTGRVEERRVMHNGTGPMIVEVPEGQDLIIVQGINLNTGEPERYEIRLE